jgi:hypothetical protein
MYWNVLECIEEHESDDARMDARLVEGKRARCIGMYWSVLRSTRATMLGWMLGWSKARELDVLECTGVY